MAKPLNTGSMICMFYAICAFVQEGSNTATQDNNNNKISNHYCDDNVSLCCFCLFRLHAHGVLRVLGEVFGDPVNERFFFNCLLRQIGFFLGFARVLLRAIGGEIGLNFSPSIDCLYVNNDGEAKLHRS